MTYSPPEHISPTHDLTTFNCGKSVLDEWLKDKALKNETSGVSRTYVICYENKVVGYYTLATGSVTHSSVTGKIKRNVPDPIPVMILGKLAIDINHRKKGLGIGLFKDAVRRTVQAADIAGIRAILIHALDEEAKNFYIKKCGCQVSPIEPLLLWVILQDAQKYLFPDLD